KPVGLELKLPLVRARAGFTLLEVVIVLFIVSLVLAAVHSIAQGTITLADDVRRAQRRDARQQAFTTFGERLFAELPPTAALNVKTTQDGGQYLSGVELHGVPSPFNGMPDMVVNLFTEPAPGGGVRMLLTCREKKQEQEPARVVLFDDLGACEWRVFDPNTRQWATLWTEPQEENARHVHPLLIEVMLTGVDGQSARRVFWIAPSEPAMVLTPAPAPAPGPGPTNPTAPVVEIPSR
ncbi:MAG: type II secretion system protein GspJ, partial [Prosthecobacter sp.]|nr:type II secretion system protein GspJ [Prosthecobacter sp.]